MRRSAIARRYARAAFDVARQDSAVERWRQDLGMVTTALQDENVAEYFRNPDSSRDDQLHTIEKVFAGLNPQAVNLLRILVVRHRLHLVPSIMEEFDDLEREQRGLLEADVTVARPVDDREKSEIAEQLGRVTGKTVEVTTHVDPHILGGLVIRLGDKLIDASVAGRLQRLRQEMAV